MSNFRIQEQNHVTKSSLGMGVGCYLFLPCFLKYGEGRLKSYSCCSQVPFITFRGALGHFTCRSSQKPKALEGWVCFGRGPAKWFVSKIGGWALEEAHGSTCTPFSFPHLPMIPMCTREQDTKPTINAITWLQPMYPPHLFLSFHSLHKPCFLISTKIHIPPLLFPFSNTHFYLASDSHQFSMVSFDHHDFCGNQMGWISTNPFHFSIEVTSFQAIGITCSHTALKSLDPQNP